MRWPAALIVTDCTFTANAAPWNATAGLDHLHYSSGGAIYVDRTTALVYYSLFRENTAAGHGGAIALVGDGRDTSYLRVQSSKFNENEGRLASAIYVYRGDSYFKSNKVYEDRIPQTFALGFNATAYGCHNDELNITLPKKEPLPEQLLWEVDRVHMKNRNPIWSSTRVGKDRDGQGEIGEPIP